MSYQLLIVDDEVLIRKALSQYIDWESLNCVVHATASNGKEAIKIIEENKIDIVITDVKMPLIDGIELSRYICKNHPNITTVILSGYAEFEYAQSAIQYHVSQYLLKPISKEKIMSCIKDIVKQKATELPADDSMNTAETAPKYSIFIKQAINYIDEHLTDDMTLETIAESVHSNASYLSRIFKKEVGTSVITYITDLRIKKAKENIKNQGKEEQITLLEGDAIEILKGLDGSFDLIFVDAAKGQYIHFMPDILRLLGPEGTLVSDNVLQDGDIIESRFAVTRRNRTIHKRMREYLYELTHDEHLVTAVLPIGDGVTVSTWKK